jgi:hypothetical protein
MTIRAATGLVCKRFRDHGNTDVARYHHMSRTNFSGFALFTHPIDHYQTVGHHRFPVSARLGDAGGFEEIAQSDEFFVKRECQIRHNGPR